MSVVFGSLKGDDQKCYEAGMDGYVSKPIRREQLFGEIDRVMKTLTPG